MDTQAFDVIIIGGSYAGLSAALALGRSLRKVLIIDGGTPCNRTTPHSHNYLTQDGSTPAEIAQIGLKQVLAYDTVEQLSDRVTEVLPNEDAFQVMTADRKRFTTPKLILATGLKDELPNIPGFDLCWGKTAIHCPYCHGYEVRGKRTGILVNDPSAIEFAKLIYNWTQHLRIFTNGSAQFDTTILQQLEIPWTETPIDHITHEEGYMQSISLQDGQTFEIEALYHRAPTRQQSDLPLSLGCELSETGHILVDDFQRTNIPGIFAAGDCTTPFRSVANAVAQGNVAGAVLNHDWIDEVWKTQS